MREEFVDPHKRSQDESDDGEMVDEVGLRPRSLSDFVGQRELKERGRSPTSSNISPSSLSSCERLCGSTNSSRTFHSQCIKRLAQQVFGGVCG